MGSITSNSKDDSPAIYLDDQKLTQMIKKISQNLKPKPKSSSSNPPDLNQLKPSSQKTNTQFCFEQDKSIKKVRHRRIPFKLTKLDENQNINQGQSLQIFPTKIQQEDIRPKTQVDKEKVINLISQSIIRIAQQSKNLQQNQQVKSKIKLNKSELRWSMNQQNQLEFVYRKSQQAKSLINLKMNSQKKLQIKQGVQQSQKQVEESITFTMNIEDLPAIMEEILKDPKLYQRQNQLL